MTVVGVPGRVVVRNGEKERVRDSQDREPSRSTSGGIERHMHLP